MVVVQRISPAEKTFTVLPISYDAADINFASWVEAEIGRAGLTVFERPPFKFSKLDATVSRSESASAAAVTANGAAGVSMATGLAEPSRFADVVSMYPEAKGTYLAITNAYNHRVRIVERATGALVASGEVPGENGDSVIYSMLVYAGFVPDKAQEKSVDLISRSAWKANSTGWESSPNKPYIRVFSKTTGDGF